VLRVDVEHAHAIEAALDGRDQWLIADDLRLDAAAQEALGELEGKSDSAKLVALFSDDCEVGNVVARENFQGTEGARRFWTNYRETFGRVQSTFLNQIITDNRAALEWRTEGTSGDGREIGYEGVSILEIEGQKVKRFYAYFDPAHLGEQIADS